MLQTVQVSTMPPAHTRPITPDDLLTVKEVSVRLDVHEKTVYRLIWASKLRYVRVGRLVKVPREAILEYLKRAMDSQ